jgi:hypothetical protein
VRWVEEEKFEDLCCLLAGVIVHLGLISSLKPQSHTPYNDMLFSHQFVEGWKLVAPGLLLLSLNIPDIEAAQTPRAPIATRSTVAGKQSDIKRVCLGTMEIVDFGTPPLFLPCSFSKCVVLLMHPFDFFCSVCSR